MSKKFCRGSIDCAQKPTKNIFQSSIIFMVITLIGGGFALLIGGRLTAPTNASHTDALISSGDLSVVGPPSLPAATVDAIFSRSGSPMAGTGKLVEQTSRQANIDDAFALAVWWRETNDGETGVGLTNSNPGGVRGSAGYPTAYSYTLYPSYSAAIADWFHILQIRYVDRGLSTVYAISHPYVGTSNSPSWAGKVIALMLQYRGEAPPPTPTVAPSPTIAPEMLPHHKVVTDPGVTRVSQPQKGIQRSSATLTLSDRAQAASTGASALSATVEWLIVVLALMLAIAVALWARSLSVGTVTLASPAMVPSILETGDASVQVTRTLPHNAPAPTGYEGRTSALRLPARPPAIPNTETLESLMEPPATPDTSPLRPFPRLPVTQGRGTFRRTLLLPAQPDIADAEMPGDTMVTTGARPSGLLARYGRTQQG